MGRELALIACACRASFAEGEPSADFDVRGNIQWDRLIALARFHRVEGIVWNWLTASGAATPGSVLHELSSDAAAIASRNLRAAAECRDLQSDFRSAEIPLLFLKGLAVGAIAYRNAALKSAIDIDILVDPANLPEAAELLRSRAYSVVIPGNPKAVDAWHGRSKETVWVSGTTGLQIDLHTHVADTPRLIPTIDVHSPRQSVAIRPDISLDTFADDELFAYLAVHGAWAAWYRLKWIADFAGFVDGRSPDDLERLYQRSLELGAGRATGQGLLLADRLFGTLRSTGELRERLERDRTTSSLAKAAFRILADEKGEPTERRLGTLKIHYLELLLVPGPTYKMSEIARQAWSFARIRV